MLSDFALQPIKLQFPRPSAKEVRELAARNKAVIINNTLSIIVENTYFQANHPGTHKQVFCRESILDRLQKISEFLYPHYGLLIFDAFRTRTTQKFLFDSFFDFIHAKKPHLNDAELQIEVRKYVSHPDEPARFAVPPHNSGGAIDLAFYNLETKKILDFGCAFDETEIISSSDFFEQEPQMELGILNEQWLHIRKNRRLLFHTMIHFGFTNFASEWWHYDLGDCLWAHEHNLDYVYSSMEQEVFEMIGTI